MIDGDVDAGGFTITNLGAPGAPSHAATKAYVDAAVGGGGGGGPVAFQYTVTGAEPDKSNLVIALPAAQADTDYAVTVTQEQFTNLLAMGVLTASKTTTQFTLSLSAIATAGDVFSFLVARLS